MQTDFYIKSGDVLPVLATSLTDALGDPIDLTQAIGVQFLMAAEGSQNLAVNASALVTGLPADGTVQYIWAPGDTNIPGNYLASFQVSYPGGVQTFPSDGFIAVSVQASLFSQAGPPPETFCSLADVTSVTGRTDVNETNLAVAYSVIEGLIGRPLYELLVGLGAEEDVLTDRDQYWLKCATAWEAAWVTDNPGTFSSYDAINVNQSGTSGTLLADALVIGPMARRCLRWVTWLKSRSVKIQRPFPYARLMNPTINDDLGAPWNQMRT
jgi:hypothetical protein